MGIEMGCELETVLLVVEIAAMLGIVIGPGIAKAIAALIGVPVWMVLMGSYALRLYVLCG